jgi:membrane-associated phospholipid phosphatase
VLVVLGWHARAGTPPAADARLHDAVAGLAPRIDARSDLLDDWIGYLAVYVTNGVALAVVAAVLGAVALRRGIRDALGVLLVLAAAVAAVYVLKAAFDRAPGAYAKYELPSGHATRSMLAAGLAVAATWRTWARWPGLAGAAAYVVAVAFSLVYVDWHLPSDVLAGWALAGVAVAAFVLIAATHRRREELPSSLSPAADEGCRPGRE